MGYEYPRLRRVFEYYNHLPHNAADCFLIGCQHLMEPQLRMFEYLAEFGFNPAKMLVLGKTYSTNGEVLGELRKRGIQARQPMFSGINFDQEHKNNCEALLHEVPENSQCVILDDGAQLIKTFIGNRHKVLFGVEQTSSGFRSLEKESLPFPVLNVARSVTKLTQEAPLVARHLNERILDYLKKNGAQNPILLVVGLGPIGESILKNFEQSGIKIDGFDVKYGHKDLISKILELKPDAIIGATGNPILTKEEVENLKLPRHLFLISASSSDREFPVAAFRSGEKTHDNVHYGNITFVNNGFPFSFVGNRYEMTPIEIEKTICLLGGAVMFGVARGVSGVGLKEIPVELENIVNS